MLPQPKAVQGLLSRHRRVRLSRRRRANYVIPSIARQSRRSSREEVPLRAHVPGAAAGRGRRRATRIVEPDRARWAPTAGSRGTCPPGKWTILRLGHTTTGKDNHPAPHRGPRPGVRQAQQGGRRGPLRRPDGQAHRRQPGRSSASKTLVSTHIDSWEVGSQNWTPKFREEFQRRRGYDPLPFLPVMTGRVVDSLEVSERFLWDVRQTISDLLLRELRRRISASWRTGTACGSPSKPTTTPPCDDMTYAGPRRRTDGASSGRGPASSARHATVAREMASAAHVYGKPHPRRRGVHRHRRREMAGPSRPTSRRWATGRSARASTASSSTATPLQPWTNPDRAPGMSMGPWGLHYERTQTWWEQSARLARVPRPLPVPAAARAVRRRPLLSRAGRLAAAVQVAGRNPAATGPATTSTAARRRSCSRACR